MRIEPTRFYASEDARGFLEEAGLDADALAPVIEGRFMAAFVRATRPAAAAAAPVDGGCCAPSCCG